MKRKWKVEWYSKLDGERVDQEAIGLQVHRFFTKSAAERHVRSIERMKHYTNTPSLVEGRAERV